MKLRLNSILESSYANGPGNRFVIWTQGCDFNCPGCFNPETHSFDGGCELETDYLFEKITQKKGIEGVSVSGGEPLLQLEPLMALLKKIKNETDLSVLVFTGFNFDEILADYNKNLALEFIDIIIAGKYERDKKVNNPLISSANQILYFLTDRYDISKIPDIDCEVIIDSTGLIAITGVRVAVIGN
ncbi:MAG: 4Fe-4S single cluster domain-containing protein [Candidatus Delongbacteria bacterium]|jgi:anaerobic ribonucleoside-triphosphate reductase activating protein|nr:4Fe-4S single cluster domain-containing protein [Candidatus Delongbacteria bacterium]